MLVTFDDGYRDYREAAYPILSALGIPALVFVTTAYIDEPTRLFWWEALALALQRTRVPRIEPRWQPGSLLAAGNRRRKSGLSPAGQAAPQERRGNGEGRDRSETCWDAWVWSPHSSSESGAC